MEKASKDRTERLGAAIRELRLERGMTLQELADKTQLSKSFLSYLERGAKSIGIDALTRLLEALDAQADSVLQKAGYVSPAARKQADLRTLLRDRLGLPQRELDEAMSYLEFLTQRNAILAIKKR